MRAYRFKREYILRMSLRRKIAPIFSPSRKISWKIPVEEDLLEKLKMIAFESVARPGPVREREMMGHVSPVIRCEEPAVSPIDRRRYDLLLVSQGRQGFCC